MSREQFVLVGDVESERRADGAELVDCVLAVDVEPVSRVDNVEPVSRVDDVELASLVDNSYE